MTIENVEDFITVSLVLLSVLFFVLAVRDWFKSMKKAREMAGAEERVRRDRECIVSDDEMMEEVQRRTMESKKIVIANRDASGKVTYTET